LAQTLSSFLKHAVHSRGQFSSNITSIVALLSAEPVARTHCVCAVFATVGQVKNCATHLD
jgi:hypothetical protein